LWENKNTRKNNTELFLQASKETGLEVNLDRSPLEKLNRCEDNNKADLAGCENRKYMCPVVSFGISSITSVAEAATQLYFLVQCKYHQLSCVIYLFMVY
jgi:hypothetical protein